MNILLRTQYIVGAGLAYSGLALDPLMDMFKMLGRTAGHLQNVVGVSSKVIAFVVNTGSLPLMYLKIGRVPLNHRLYLKEKRTFQRLMTKLSPCTQKE